MEQERIEQLIVKFNQDRADASEVKLIEQLLEEGKIQLSQLSQIDLFDTRIGEMESPAPSRDLDESFYKKIRSEKSKNSKFFWNKFFSWPDFMPKLALASLTLLLGFWVGYSLNSSSSSVQVKELSQQVIELKEMMMLSLLEKESASERLKAVSLTNEMDDASDKVTEALLQTLNYDDNINVRLAALDALKPFARNNRVREGIVRSIAKQDSPLVQLELAELMVVLQERSSVKEFEKILKADQTPREVKNRIEESIKAMI